MQPTDDIRSDETIAKMLSKMPEDVQASFTEPQLTQLRLVLGARQWGKHKIDLRGTFGFGRTRYYYVFVAGKNIRHYQRPGQVSRLMLATLIAAGLISATVVGLLLLYLLKSALGIDIFEGFSLGIWHWFQSL